MNIKNPYACERQKVDPLVRQFLDAGAALGLPPLESLPVPEARRMAAEGISVSGGTAEAVRSVEDRKIPGPEGDPSGSTPDAPARMPALVYFHGGGWVLCDLDTHAIVCSAIARRAGAAAVAVDYRLAPSIGFPPPCSTVTLQPGGWLNTRVNSASTRRGSAWAASAGGNLATVVSLKAGRRTVRRLRCRRWYIRLRTFPHLTRRRIASSQPDINSRSHRWNGFAIRTRRTRRSAAVRIIAAVGLGPERLPPALVITASAIRRDEGEAYANRLMDAGVPVTLKRYAGMIHPFFSLSARPAGTRGDSAGGRCGAEL